ncbi:flagellar filament capping protein FliD [Cytobacillus sp. Hm23]
MTGLRIGGLASGMDTDQIIADLMKAERMPLDRLTQKRQILEWQLDSYREMNTLLLDFREELTRMKMPSTYSARTITSTNEAMVTAIASSASPQATYAIDNVTQLATAATKVNAGAISADADNKINVDKGLYSNSSAFADGTAFNWRVGAVESKSISVEVEGDSFQLFEAGEVHPPLKDFESWSVTVDGKSYKVVTSPAEPPKENEVFIDTDGSMKFGTELKADSSINVNYIADYKTETKTLTEGTKEWQLPNGSINSVTSFIIEGNEEFVLGGSDGDVERDLVLKDDSNVVIGKINTETGKIVFNMDEGFPQDTEVEIIYDHNYTNFSIDTSTSKGDMHHNFIIGGNESLNTVISRVNNSEVGVTMYYDSFSDQVTLTRNETGDFTDSGDEIRTSGGFLNDVLRFRDADETGGTNIKFEVNGLSTERNSNTFNMSGVEFSIKQTFSNSPVSISVNNDSNQVLENIKSFVEKYNELIDKINQKVSEDRYRDYPPLTSEERQALSEREQELWDEKAMSGLIRNDSILTGVLSQMRTDLYAPVDNDDVSSIYNQLASIGITTTANYLEGGKLEINETKLLNAIQEDPSSVEKLFNADGNTSSEQGVIQRLYDSVNVAMEKLTDKAGKSYSAAESFAIGKEMSYLDDQIDSFERRLIQIEDRYWGQFTAMELAIQQANEQAMFLAGQFGY